MNIKTDQANQILQKLDEMSGDIKNLSADVTDLKIASAQHTEQLKAMDIKFTEQNKGLEAKITEQFKGVDIKFEGINTKFEGVDTKFESIGDRLSSLEERTTSQDKRLWSFIGGFVIVLLGTLTKLLFFPSLGS